MRNSSGGHSAARSILITLVLFVSQTNFSHAQTPLTIGELIIRIENPPENASISVDAQSGVYGSYVYWYPLIPDRWDSYSGGSYKVCQFIDRNGWPNGDTIGYGKYRITCMSSYYVDIDYRDPGYGWLQGEYPSQDLYLYFNNSTHTWRYWAVGDTQALANYSSKGIWEFWFSQGYGTPEVPITVRCFLNGGYSGTVVVDQSIHSSPYKTKWNAGNHTIAAPAIQGGSWWFDHWSDGGAQSHTVTAGVSQFGAVYTAYYRHDLLAPEDSGPSLSSYPNPFNPSTSISYTVQARGHVKLSIFDIVGREVSGLVDEVQDAGRHAVVFDGSRLASGIYFCRLLEPAGKSQTLQLHLAK